VKKKRRRATDLAKESIEEESVEEEGVGAGGRQVLSVMEVERRGERKTAMRVASNAE